MPASPGRNWPVCASQAAMKSWPPWYSLTARSSARMQPGGGREERHASARGRRRSGARTAGIAGVSYFCGLAAKSVCSVMSLPLVLAVAGLAGRVEDVGRARRRRSSPTFGPTPPFGHSTGPIAGAPVTPSPTTGSSSGWSWATFTGQPGRNGPPAWSSPSGWIANTRPLVLRGHRRGCRDRDAARPAPAARPSRR